MFCVFKDIAIVGISSCVPKNVVENNEENLKMTSEEIGKLVDSIGIKERRFAGKDVTALDLCYKAAYNLLDFMQFDKDSIDAVVFMTQTPDYLIPANSPIIQDKLGLRKDIISFDIGLACSGYVYSLFVAYSLLQNPSINNVLLLDGETFSKHINPLDKVNYPLYGDAGTATLVSRKATMENSYFSLYTDGSGYKSVIIESGAYRNPITVSGLTEIKRNDGNYRRLNDIYMDAIEVFNFTMREIPKSIKSILQNSGLTIDNIDLYILHQANKFMTDFIAKKLKIPPEKMLYSIGKYGNTSSASIPLTLSENCDKFKENNRILISGFGGGLSWANAILNLEDIVILSPLDY